MEQPVDLLRCKLTAQQPDLLPNSACECCGKSLESDSGSRAILIYAVVECHGRHKICLDCEKVVKWICEKQRAIS